MSKMQNQQHGNGNTTVAVSDNTRTNAKKQAELAYQNRPRTKLQFLKEAADRRAEQAVKEREARRKDPEYDEKKRKAKVAEQLKQNDDGKYTSKKETFVGRLADNLYHNSGASYYVDRAKRLAEEGATPLEQTANAGLGIIGTAMGSLIGGVDAVGKGLGSNANVGTAAMGLLAETPIGGVPMTLMETGRQLGGSRGETAGELLATIMPVGRGRPVRLAPGQRGIPTVRIQGDGTPLYYFATPNPNVSSRTRIGSNLFDIPMSKTEIAEAIQNGTMQYADLNGNVLGTWRNIDHNGGVHIQMRRNRNGGYYLPDNQPAVGYLPNGQRVTMDPALAREYLNGTRRYPSLLTDAQAQEFATRMRGTSAVFDGYGIEGPRYRVNYADGSTSVPIHYPNIANTIRIREPLEQFMSRWHGDELAGKWTWMEQNANNPQLVKSIRQAVESGQDTSPILSKLSNKQIDFLVGNGMLNEPGYTGNMVVKYDEAGNPRPFSLREILHSVEQDWAGRKRGSVFDFATTNSYSYQSYLLALRNLAKRIENGEARILKPGDRKIYPNDYASIEFISPTGETITYPNARYGSGYGRTGGAMQLDALNKQYRQVYEKLNALGQKQYGEQWTPVVWEDITPQQLIDQYQRGLDPRRHHDWKMLIYKNGGKPQLYNRRVISKIKNV